MEQQQAERVPYTEWRECPYCLGSGDPESPLDLWCWNCSGKGEVMLTFYEEDEDDQ